MKKRLPYSGLLLATLLVFGCAGNPGPGDSGYPFNVAGTYTGGVVVEGETFSVEMDLRTLPGGALEGEYRVTSPVEMSGPVTGSVAADSITFKLNYLNPMDGCDGILDGTGTVVDGGGEFDGTAQVNDSCGGYLAGTFSFKR